jgi:hypothetical protein
MALEGPPEVPEKKEQEPLTDERCLEAMKAGDFETVRSWYDQEGAKAEADRTSGRGHFDLTIRLAALQFEAGIIDEETGELYAFQTLKDAVTHADQARSWEDVDRLDAIIAEYRKASPKA